MRDKLSSTYGPDAPCFSCEQRPQKYLTGLCEGCHRVACRIGGIHADSDQIVILSDKCPDFNQRAIEWLDDGLEQIQGIAQMVVDGNLLGTDRKRLAEMILEIAVHARKRAVDTYLKEPSK